MMIRPAQRELAAEVAGMRLFDEVSVANHGVQQPRLRVRRSGVPTVAQPGRLLIQL